MTRSRVSMGAFSRSLSASSQYSHPLDLSVPASLPGARSISLFISEVTRWMIPRKMCTRNVSQTIADTRCGFPNRAGRSRPATHRMDSRSGMLAMSVRRAHSMFFLTYVMGQTMLFINVPVSLSALISSHLILMSKSTSYPTLILPVVLSLPLA